MNFQQLRSVRESVRQGFNLTTVAEVLHTSQPGVSRQIRELEDELAIEIFVRAGKRLTGRSHIDDAFKRQGMDFNRVLSAMDADVIKTCVDLGMGVGIIAGMTYDESRDTHLRAIDARHLFASNMTRLALRRGSFLRSYVYDFIQSFASPLTREVVERSLATAPGTRLDI